MIKDMVPEIREGEMGYSHLGKLGFKIEAAGKIRVFAMVDAYTQ